VHRSRAALPKLTGGKITTAFDRVELISDALTAILPPRQASP
jgi:hypothetical protein